MLDGSAGAAVLLAALVASTGAFAAAAPASPGEPLLRTPILETVARVLALREEQINIGDVALQLSTLLAPETDVDAGRRQLGELAQRVAALVGSQTDAEFRIRAVNTVLYREAGFHYDMDDLLARNPRNSLLANLLRTRKGNCASLPLLWYAVAERLGYPVVAVQAPQHLFLRYNAGARWINVEATSATVPTDEQIIADTQIPPEGLRSGAFMRNLTKRELVAEMVADLGTLLLQLRDLGAAEQLLHAAETVVPNSVEVHWSLAQVYAAVASMREQVLAAIPGAKRGKGGRAEVDVAEWRLALDHARKATALGATEPLKEGYWLKAIKGDPETSRPVSPPKPFDVAQLVRPPRGVTVVDSSAPAKVVKVPVAANCPQSSGGGGFGGGYAVAASCARCQRMSLGLAIEECFEALRDPSCADCAANPRGGRDGFGADNSGMTLQEARTGRASDRGIQDFGASPGGGGSTMIGGFEADQGVNPACGLCRAHQPAYSRCASRMQDGDCRRCMEGP